MKNDEIVIKLMNQYLEFREDYMRKPSTIHLYLPYRCGFFFQF